VSVDLVRAVGMGCAAAKHRRCTQLGFYLVDCMADMALQQTFQLYNTGCHAGHAKLPALCPLLCSRTCSSCCGTASSMPVRFDSYASFEFGLA
jgi:hypothetical protein